MKQLSEFERGVLTGVLVGEGSFGGDGRQPQLTLKMHVRHERLFRWLCEAVPESRLYGPYSSGSRTWYQWMVRGAALGELLAQLWPAIRELDDYAALRVQDMCERYGIELPSR